MTDTMIRVDEKFEAEVKLIKKRVRELCGKKYSDRKITNMIHRHNLWETIREDIAVNLIEDSKKKRGRPYDKE